MRLRTLAAAAALLAVAVAPVRAQTEGGDRATLARLEQRAKSFYELLERGERSQASAVWPDLANDLESFAAGVQARLGRMRDEAAENETLDDLLQSPRFREPEVMELVATYHLAWVRYQGAQLTADAAKKKELLHRAVEGFTQFLLVNEVPEIYGESLYGRGLAFLDLGETQKAIEDLSAAVEEGRIGGKARAALDEARRRAVGGRAPAAENDPEALLARVGDLIATTNNDPGREKEATALARGLAARGGTWPARVGSLVTDKLGATPRSSYGIYLLAQLAVDRGRCADVPALAEASGKVEDTGRTRLRPEILFLDAGCRLNGGKARDAAERFAALLAEYPDAPRAAEAAYYRFRALDVARADDPSLVPAYEAAVTGYLERHPKGDGVPEARFALAELYRSRGDCRRASDEYGRVPSGKYAARARLGALECRVAALATAKGAGGERRQILEGLRAFVHDTPARGEDQALVARAALLGALVAAGATPPDNAAVIQLTDGFEAHYSEARDLQPRAVALRLVAQVGEGDFAAADRDLDALLRRPSRDDETRRTLVRVGRDLVARVERTPDAERGPALVLARRVYGALVDGGGDAAARIALADLDLRAGDATAARKLYEAALAANGDSSEALRGAARAAAAAGDRDAALAYWRRILEGSPPGGTAWYEARVAQVTLLAESGRRDQACGVLRGARGRATTAGAEQLEARLRGMEAEVCR